jgi:protein-tyrosine phosphatase
MSLRILAVCAGNICRSPAAEAAIRAAAAERAVDVDVDSAGTGSWNLGEAPNIQAVEAGRRVGLEIDGRARKVNVADFDRFDVIVVMDRSNLRDVTSLAPSLEARAKVRLFRTYESSSELDEIPDPYGRSDQVFDETVTVIRSAARGLIDSLVSVGVEDPVALE